MHYRQWNKEPASSLGDFLSHLLNGKSKASPMSDDQEKKKKELLDAAKSMERMKSVTTESADKQRAEQRAANRLDVVNSAKTQDSLAVGTRSQTEKRSSNDSRSRENRERQSEQRSEATNAQDRESLLEAAKQASEKKLRDEPKATEKLDQSTLKREATQPLPKGVETVTRQEVPRAVNDLPKPTVMKEANNERTLEGTKATIGETRSAQQPEKRSAERPAAKTSETVQALEVDSRKHETRPGSPASRFAEHPKEQRRPTENSSAKETSQPHDQREQATPATKESSQRSKAELEQRSANRLDTGFKRQEAVTTSNRQAEQRKGSDVRSVEPTQSQSALSDTSERTQLKQSQKVEQARSAKVLETAPKTTEKQEPKSETVRPDDASSKTERHPRQEAVSKPGTKESQATAKISEESQHAPQPRENDSAKSSNMSREVVNEPREHSQSRSETSPLFAERPKGCVAAEKASFPESARSSTATEQRTNETLTRSRTRTEHSQKATTPQEQRPGEKGDSTTERKAVETRIDAKPQLAAKQEVEQKSQEKREIANFHHEKPDELRRQEAPKPEKPDREISKEFLNKPAVKAEAEKARELNEPKQVSASETASHTSTEKKDVTPPIDALHSLTENPQKSSPESISEPTRRTAESNNGLRDSKTTNERVTNELQHLEKVKERTGTEPIPGNVSESRLSEQKEEPKTNSSGEIDRNRNLEGRRPWTDSDTVACNEIVDRAHNARLEIQKAEDAGDEAAQMKAEAAYGREIENLKHYAENVDIREETKGNHVFYAKENRFTAEAFATEADGYWTLDGTSVGIAFHKMELHVHIKENDSREIWGTLSSRFASDARGTPVVFDHGYPKMDADSQLYTHEFPELGANPYIDSTSFNPAQKKWNRYRII